MNIKDWILELSHNRWGEDSLYQDYDYTDVFTCPVFELVVNEEVAFRNKKGPWNNNGWWNPTIRVGEVADDHVSLYIYYTKSVNTTTKSRADVVFDKDNREWETSCYGGKSSDAYHLILRPKDEN